MLNNIFIYRFRLSDNQTRLRCHWVELIDTLVVDDANVIDQLYQNEYVSADDMERILSGNTHKYKTR